MRAAPASSCLFTCDRPLHTTTAAAYVCLIEHSAPTGHIPVFPLDARTPHLASEVCSSEAAVECVRDAASASDAGNIGRGGGNEEGLRTADARNTASMRFL